MAKTRRSTKKPIKSSKRQRRLSYGGKRVKRRSKPRRLEISATEIQRRRDICSKESSRDKYKPLGTKYRDSIFNECWERMADEHQQNYWSSEIRRNKKDDYENYVKSHRLDEPSRETVESIIRGVTGKTISPYGLTKRSEMKQIEIPRFFYEKSKPKYEETYEGIPFRYNNQRIRPNFFGLFGSSKSDM